MAARSESGAAPRTRIDKWLWAARFFKTRALATEAVSGGHVHLNGTRVKPSRAVNIGDELTIRKGEQEFAIHVCRLSERRGPAREAQKLYEETPESIARREETAQARRIAAASAPRPEGRPDKRSRRKIIRFINKDRG